MSEPFRKPRIYPLAWFALGLTAMICLDRWLPVVTLIPQPSNWFGLVLTVPGLAVVLHSGAVFLKARTGLLPFSEATRLVTGGPYRYTRNPMYLGMVTFLAGFAVILGSVSAFVPVILFAWIIDRQFIQNEEKFLLAEFGTEYREYMLKVRRWI